MTNISRKTKSIAVEGILDVSLARVCSFRRKDISKLGGKGNVLKNLKDCKDKIAIVDERANELNLPEDYKTNYESIDKSGDLELKVRKTDHTKFVIIISPYNEQWVYKRAQICNINPCHYSLPDKPNTLHDHSK